MKDRKYVQGIITGLASTLVVMALILGVIFYKYRDSYNILFNNTETVKEIEKSEDVIFAKIKHLMGMIDERGKPWVISYCAV